MKDEKPLPLGTITSWGAVAAVGMVGGERYYWMRRGLDDVAMMPASVVEDSGKDRGADAEV